MRATKTVLSLAIAAALLLAGGCDDEPAVEYTRSDRQPVLVYFTTQALPPMYSPKGPDLIVYGSGTAYKKSGLMDYTTGVLSADEVTTLLSSVVEKGFFSLEGEQGEPMPGAAVSHVTVTLSSESKGLEGTSTTGAFGEIVTILKDFEIPGATEYLPDTIVLNASAHEGTQPFSGTVLEWTASPADLEQAARLEGYSLNGEEARQAWKLLADAYRAGPGDVAWRAGGRLYTQVFADPQFPAPGI